MSSFVYTVNVVGDEALATSIIERTVETIVDINCSVVGVAAFYSCKSLTEVNFQACTKISSNAFLACGSLSSALFPVCESVLSSAFCSCPKLTTVSFPACEYIGDSAFAKCVSLTAVSFPVCTKIVGAAFLDCSSLISVTLGASTVCSMQKSTAFNRTPIKSGAGYIYVPASLVDSYKAATNWSLYANQIVAMDSD